MVTKEVLAKFLKLSTDRIYAGLDTGKWSGESHEAAIQVLKNRGKDISKYLNSTSEESQEEEEEMPAKSISTEKIEELTTLISEELEGNDKQMIDAIESIVGQGDNIASLPEETIDKTIAFIKDKRKDRKIAEKKKQRVPAKYKAVKDMTLSPEKQAIADEILAKTDLTKKQKLLEMWNQGLTRTETLSLHFMDPTYIYDLYREIAQ